MNKANYEKIEVKVKEDSSIHLYENIGDKKNYSKT